MSKESPVKELKEESKGKGGSWLYGFILMGSGIFITVLGILELMNYSLVYTLLVENGVEDFAVMMSIGGVMNFIIAIFAIGAGFGLIIDQEWAWGISMLVLVFSTGVSIKNIIERFMSLGINPNDPLAVGIIVISFVIIGISVVGLIYLGLTKYKYA